MTSKSAYYAFQKWESSYTQLCNQLHTLKVSMGNYLVKKKFGGVVIPSVLDNSISTC